jgi:uncharacterized protein
MTNPFSRLRVGAATLFFRSFFWSLLLVTAVAEWTCAMWVAYVASGYEAPNWLHVVGPAVIFAANRALVWQRGARRSPAAKSVLRFYTAVAFVSLFCFVFLLGSGTVWVVVRSLVGALRAQAVTVRAGTALGAGVDGVFEWGATIGMAAIALTMGYGYVFGQRELCVREVSLRVRGLRDDGRLRIVQISDIHVGQNLSPQQLEGFVERVNSLSADLICITGDIADSALADLDRFFPVLGQLRARHGVCAILGNHDHYAGSERVIAALQRYTDFRVLRDEAVTLRLGDAALYVIGLDDRGRDWARGVESDADLANLAEAAPPGTPILLLAHRPDIFDQAIDAGIALTLSGHTHGGQLALPWFGGRRRNLAEFITRYDRGLYRRGESALYVNCGLGVTGQRIRLFTPREISVLELSGITAAPASPLSAGASA